METSQSILVTNLPDFKEKKLKDKLEIHFGKRGNGGGDVDQILITEQCGSIGTFAVITFAEKETVASVLGKQHIFFGRKLTVEPHSPTEEEQCNTDHNASKKIRLAKLPQLPSQDLKLIIHGRYADDVLKSTAVISNATLQVDEKSTKVYLKGPTGAIVQAVDILGKHDTYIRTRGLGNVGLRNNKANGMTSVEKHKHQAEELIADKKSCHSFSGAKKLSEADPPKVVESGTTSSPGRKNVPKLSWKRNDHLTNTDKLSRNIVKFDPKILNYIQAVQHRVITEAGDRFKVNFEAKPDGEVEFKRRGQNTNPQSVNESMKFLENFVNGIQKMGLVTEIENLMQFEGASKQNVDEAVKQVLESTDVLVSVRARNTLEFYGTKHSVHQEIEKLRAGILGRELQTDSQDDIRQTVNNKTNGDRTQSPHEELGNMAMVGNSKAKEYSERLASLDGTSSAKKVQFKKSDDAPSRKLLVHPLVTPEGSTALEAVQISFAENSIDEETCLPPEGPPTWKEKSYPSLCSSVTYGISYPPSQATEENQASKQSWYPVEQTTYVNEQKKSSDRVPKEEVDTARPNVTYAYMIQETYSPPMQHSRLQGTTQDDAEEKASRSCQNDESTKMVDMSLDEVNGAGALFMANGSAMSEMPDLEPSPGCVPSEESSRGRDSPMETEDIFPSSAAVSSPWDSLLVSCPPGAFPVGISMGSSTQSDEDFTVTIRTGMQVIIRHGDITDEFTGVIVTSADRNLHLKDGVGRAVREAAGQELVGACQRWVIKNGPVEYGKNVWTVGGNLKCSHVLHVVLRQSQGGMSHGTELKKTFMDLLKTCSYSLQASHVSMPAIGKEKMSVSNKVWARAFFEAVCEITQLYDKGWMQLSTLVLVDRNRALIREVQRVFKDPILSGAFEESFQNVWQDSLFTSSSSSFTGNGAFDVPRLRARGPNRVNRRMTVQNGSSSRGFSNLQSFNRSSSSGKKISSGVKSAFNDELPVDPDHKCAICLGRINQEKRLRCKHSFCRDCVDMALKERNNCPICRQPVR